MTETEVHLMRVLYELADILLRSSVLPAAQDNQVRELVRGIEADYSESVLNSDLRRS